MELFDFKIGGDAGDPVTNNKIKRALNEIIDRLTDGSVGSSVEVRDEGVLISSKAKVINFIGGQVRAVSSDGETVVVQVPPSSNPSHFATTDGINNPTPSNLVTTARTIPNGTFNIGNWTPNTNHPAIKENLITYDTVTQFLNDDSSSLFNVTVLGADNPNSLVEHEVIIDGNKDVTLNGIRIEILSFTNLSPASICRARVTVDLNTIINNKSGRFSVVISSITGGNTYTFTDADIFYDKNSIDPTMGIPSIGVLTPVLKNLSGVSYLTSGSIFSITINNINNLLKDSYKNQMLIINGFSGLGDLLINPNQLTGFTGDANDNNLSYSNSSWSFGGSNFFIESQNQRVSAYLSDWVDLNTVLSSPLSILADTLTNNSTRIYEDFRGEGRRLTNAKTTWDSNQNILTYDGGDGLQVSGSNLIYPNKDYSTFINPVGGLKPNYLTTLQDKFYITEFNKQLVSKSNGIFQFSGNITEADLLNGYFGVYISLDWNTWFDLSLPYAGGALSDGSGCRIEEDVYNLSSTNKKIRFTLGNGLFTDATSGNGWGMFVKIKMKSTTIMLDSIQLTDWV